MKRLMVAVSMVLLCGCEPVAPVAAPTPVTNVVTPPEHADACRRDIPDCEAACALRETNRNDYIEWFDRRCAAVILGKNPDKAIGQLPPDTRDALEAVSHPETNPTPSASASAGTPPLMPTSRQLPPPLDPFAGRNNNPEPAECTAARSMRAHGKIREADVLAALCSAKGGSETKEHKDIDLGF